MRPALVAALLAVLAAGAGAAARPAVGSRIVFAANRLPRWYGEIYRVTATGHRIDLSNSPAADVAPAVSPDGRWVAFLSARGGAWGVWVVGIDGRGLRRLTPPLVTLDATQQAFAQIVWTQDSRMLAAVVARAVGGATLYIGERTATLQRVAGGVGEQGQVPIAWSPDGRLLAYTTSLGGVDVVTPGGKRLWTISGAIGPSAWSAADRLAVSSVRSTVSVFDAHGTLLTRFAGTLPGWSPDGTLLASATPYAVQIRTGGVGSPVVRWPLRTTQLEWVGSKRLRALGRAGWIGYDVAARRAWTLTGVATTFQSAVSSTGAAIAVSYGSIAAGTSLVRSSPGSAATTTVAWAPYCGDDGSFADLAFVPHGGGAIYELDCDAPSADIYSVTPDGSGLRQLTRTPENEIEPSLSPDRRSVVFTQEPYAARCDGCALTLWSVPAAGGEPHQLTSHGSTDPSPFDENPSWSPDGSELVFENSGTERSRLMTMPAGGGPARALDGNGEVMPTWTANGVIALDWRVRTFRAVLVDPSTGAARVIAQGKAPDPLAFAVSKDGRLAYLYLDARGRAFVGVAGSTAKPLDLSALLAPHARVAGLAWSPDGTRFAFAADDADGVGEIWTICVDGRGIRQLTRNVGALDAVAQQGTLSWG